MRFVPVLCFSAANLLLSEGIRNYSDTNVYYDIIRYTFNRKKANIFVLYTLSRVHLSE